MNADALWLLLSTVKDDPTAGPDSSLAAADDGTVRAAFSLAEANGMFYHMATRWLAAGPPLPAEAESSWRAVSRQREEFRRTLVHLNRAATISGRDYVVIKDYRVVENVPRDIDVFVRESDQGPFLKALTEAGFEFAYRDEAEVSMARQGCLRIDVYGRIHYLRRDFLDADYLHESTRTTTTHGEEHPGLCPEAAYLLNSAHGLFGHAALTLLDFLDFRALRDQIPDAAGMRERAERHGWGRVLDRWNMHLRDLESALYRDRKAVRFPVRNGRRFIMRSVDELDGEPLSRHDRRALSLSLLWDDLVFISESSGVADALRKSGIASSAGNLAGHRIRLMRGDRKGYGIAERARGGP